MPGAYLLDLPGSTAYGEALVLQRSLAAAVSQGEIPDTVILLEHEPVVTLGRRTDGSELHLPEGIEVDVVETDRGGKSTYHGPGQLVCYPILDLTGTGATSGSTSATWSKRSSRRSRRSGWPGRGSTA